MNNEANLQRHLGRNLQRTTYVAGVTADAGKDNSEAPLPPTAQPTTPGAVAGEEDVSQLAKKIREKHILEERKKNSRDPKELPEDNILIYIPPIPNYMRYEPRTLDEKESIERRALITEAITDSRVSTAFPLACTFINQWLQGLSKLRVFSKEDIPWDNSGLDILANLYALGKNTNESHISKLAKGIIRRSNTQDKDYVPPNKKNVLYYQNSVGTMTDLLRALKMGDQPRLPDAFFSLGTFMLATELVYHVTSNNATSKTIVIDRWRCQVFDTYDWDINEPEKPPEDRQVFFFAPDDILKKTNFMLRYKEDYVLDTKESKIINLVKGLKGKFEGISVVALDVNFFIELEVSGKLPRPHWFDVISNVEDITKWKEDILMYIRDNLKK